MNNSPFFLSVSTENDTMILTDNMREFLVQYDGFNPPKANLLSTNIYNKNGALFTSSKAQTRAITLNVYIFKHVTFWRQRFYELFRIGNTVTFRYEKESQIRTISAVVETIEAPQFDEPEKAKQVVQIGLVSFDPYWIAPDKFISGTYTNEASASGTTNQIGNLENNGDIACGVRVEVACTAGAFSAPKISVGDGLLNLPSASISANETLIIDTAQKTIVKVASGVETNFINHWTHGNEWLTIDSGASKLISFICNPYVSGCTITVKAIINELYQGV